MVNRNDLLTLNAPGAQWNEQFMLGNGHIGAMQSGGIDADVILLNDEGLYDGFPIDDNNPKAKESLGEIRQLLLDGENIEAQKLAFETLVSQPSRVSSYQLLSRLYIEFAPGRSGEYSDYTRTLDLSTGLSTTTFTLDGAHYTYEAFASMADDVLALRYKTDRAGGFPDTKIQFYRGNDGRGETTGAQEISQVGTITNEYLPGEFLKFHTRLCAFVKGGKAVSQNGILTITGANEFVLFLSSKTDYDVKLLNFNREICPEQITLDILEKADTDFDRQFQKSAKIHGGLYNRVRLSLNGAPSEGFLSDQLSAAQQGDYDSGLVEKTFNYGRYLLIASSAGHAQLPANLQGIWCWELKAPWNADFHTNINLQMNYWACENGNLSETALPLTNLMESLTVPGAVTAEKMYGCRGWTFHHLVTAYGRTALHDSIITGTLPLGGAWMTQHLFDHYEYTSDQSYLRRVYPVLRGCAEFICDFVFEDKNGNLVTAPSASPENSFIMDDGTQIAFTYGATIDLEIIDLTLRNCIYAAGLLGEDEPLRRKWEEVRSRLAPIRISKKFDTIQEWIEDYDESEPGHRHISHLFGVFPSDQITKDTPELYAAAKRTIERRIRYGGAHCGWSRAWTSLFFSRFKNGDMAEKYLYEFIRHSMTGILYETFDDGSGPGFQIDGNLGFVAAVLEMLMQSHEGSAGNRIISVLPALPQRWSNGSVSGLVARGGFEIGIAWKDGLAEQVDILSKAGGTCRVALQNAEQMRVFSGGQEIPVQHIDGVLVWETEKGESYQIRA